MTREGWFGIGCKTIAWALILFAVQGCTTQKEATVVVPSCVPLTAVPNSVLDGAFDELSAHPELKDTYTLVSDWISMRDDDRVCIAHRKNAQKAISK